MELDVLYHQVKESVSSLDHNRIWPGFKPLRFALYDDKRCYFDGQWVEKTDAFCANTSIVFNGEQIAIWMVQEELKPSVLASKLVHEMFHGYQNMTGVMLNAPNEFEALFRYKYDAENLSLKLRENELLLELMDQFDEDKLAELLAHRKLRSELFPYEFAYETKEEEIEGAANYVEWQVLKQLDESAADALTARMREMMTKPEFLFPIRISCYYTGALMINALLAAGMYGFEPSVRSVLLSVLDDIAPSCGDLPDKEALKSAAESAVKAFNKKTDEIIRSALENGQVVLNGPAELKGVNVYNARCLNGFITSTYFLMYNDGAEDKMLFGDFVIEMQDEKTIARAYRWL
ncbi:MAG: hypothetical protein J5854_03715 [Clostridia bacterium]|nr:hypothetical protein [Clostridia bacterium]